MPTGPLMQMFTESDNVTQDLYRYLSLLAILVGLGLEIYVVAFKAQVFDIQTFGIGVGVLFVGMGASLRLKADTPAGIVTTSSASATTVLTEKVVAP